MKRWLPIKRRRRKKKKKKKAKGPPPLWRRLLVLGAKGVAVLTAVLILLVATLRFVNPPLNIYQAQEWVRLGSLKKDWVQLTTLPTFVPLSAAAGEDANFCTHWGFDFVAIRQALGDGASRGASTISQQTAKNVFLWQGRSWLRKGLEAGFTLLIETIWGKRRIMEVYLNVAEFDEGVFGIQAAALHHFGKPAAELSRAQAARLIAVLPNPKVRSAVRPSSATARRARVIASGAQTLEVDGRGGCLAR